MPTAKVTWDAKLIDLFLSLYDGGQWAEALTHRDRPDTRMDGGIDMLAVRKSDGQRLAIEHTRVEPFDGERSDYYKHFQPLQHGLRSDASLLVPGSAIYVEAPVRALPRKVDQPAIIAEVAHWLRTEHPSFSEERSERRCPTPHHPDGSLLLRVRKVSLRSTASFLIVHRYGEIRVGEAVEKALRRKLPKLTHEDADRRLLILERDQGWLAPEDILAEVERHRQSYPQLADVNEIWIADTASFDDTKSYVAFTCATHPEAFEFYGGALFALYRNGMPVHPLPPYATKLPTE